MRDDSGSRELLRRKNASAQTAFTAPSSATDSEVAPDVGPDAKPNDREELAVGHHFASLRPHAEPACSQGVPVQRETDPLTLSEPGDASEQEADRVADAVMRMSAPADRVAPRGGTAVKKVQRKCACEDEGHPCDECKEKKEREKGARLARHAAVGDRHDDDAHLDANAGALVRETLGAPGEPLDPEARGLVEPRFGHDFSRVRVHTDSRAAESASAVGALAYAAGPNIVFAPGQYAPGTAAGQRLLAHELTHVVQQSASTPLAPSAPGSLTIGRSTTPGVIARQVETAPAPGETATPKREPWESGGETPGTTASAAGSTADGRPPAPKKNAPPPTSSETIGAGKPPTTGDVNSQIPGVDSSKGKPAPRPAGAELSGGSKNGASQPGKAAGPEGSNGKPRDATPAGGAGGGAGRGGGGSGSEAGGGGGRAGGPGAPVGAPTPPVVELDTSSAEGLLGSLASTAASAFVTAVPMARGAVAEIQTSEKSEATENLPEIDQPTGLPTLKSTASAKETTLTPGHAPDAPAAEARAAEPTESAPPEPSGPVPGSQISTAVSEPQVAEDDGGSWWSWLVDRVQNFLSSVPTSDPELSTSAGPRDHVDLSGDADPSQNAHHEEDSHTEVTARQTEADSATSEDFGENRIFPSVPTKRMRPTYQPSGARGAAGGRSPGSPPVLPDKERAEFDHNASPALNEQMREHAARQHAERAEYDRKTTEAHEEGQRRLEEENSAARTEQEEEQRKARGEVETGRESWRAENQKIRDEFGTQSTAKRAEIDKQIGDKVRTSEADVDQKLTEAEKTAYEEKRKAEAEAAEKKREAENRPQSWWERAKGAVSDVFGAIKSVVNGIFDRVRAAVKTIIDTAKSIVHGIIDAARNAIVGLIKGFGEALKGLVTIALAAFPETAARAREWIDTKVEAATETVNRVADRLKRAADVILDTVAKAIDLALSVMQASFNAALDVAEYLALAPFEAMEALAELVALLEKIGPFIEGAQRVQDNPDAVIDALKASIGGMIAEVPGRAYAALEEALSHAGATVKRHFDGVWRHLAQGLEHLKTSWWEEVKKLGWNLLWPWPAVWKDLKQIWELIAVAGTAVGNLEVSKAIDTGLKITQLFNGILGNLYGWFFIASVLVGTVVGAFFGGVGAVPGFWAGVAFAGEVGEGLLAILIATETAVIAKSGVDLALGENTPEQDEEDYGQIAGSVLTLAITGALVLIGEIAAKLAKAVWEGVSGLFRGGEAPEAGVRVDAPEGAGEGAGERAGEGPQAEPAPAERAEPQAEPAPAEGAEPQAEPRAAEAEPELVDGEPVVAEEPVGNGEHEVKVTEDGEVLFCSDCAALRREFAPELADPNNAALKAELDAADALTDPAAKARAEAEIADRLAQVRDQNARRPSLSAERGKTTPKTASEAESVLQAERENLLGGRKARRPDPARGEPDLDFALDDPNNPRAAPEFVDIKTPVDPTLNSIQNQAADIAGKVALYDSNVRVVIDLKNIPVADKAAFIQELVNNGLDLGRVSIING